jgi:hypothetical protein
MVHAIRDMDTHLRNTWQWDAWGFTESWGNCTMSDMDGFVPFLAERRGKFLVVEMKHWNGQGQMPEIKMNSGQLRALWELSKQDNFVVVFGFGDTSTQTVHWFQVWKAGKTWEGNITFKDYLHGWFAAATEGK